MSVCRSIEGLRATLERKAPVQKYRLKDRSYGEGGLVNGLSWSDTERLDELAYGDQRIAISVD